VADSKKYYYLKLKDNFFGSDEMMILETLQDGFLYSNILIKMYLRSLKNDGVLMINNKIPYNAQALAKVTGHSVGTIEKAIKIFQELGLIEILDSGAIFMMDIHSFIGKSSTEADRIRAFRTRAETEKKEQKKLSNSNNVTNVREMYDKRTPEIEIEIEIEKERERDNMSGAKICTEPTEDIFIKLLLNDNSEFPISKNQVKEWIELYPAVNVDRELKKMKGWLSANRKRRKTKSGIIRFVNAWLARQQDKPHIINSVNQINKSTNVANFEQRQYDEDYLNGMIDDPTKYLEGENSNEKNNRNGQINS